MMRMTTITVCVLLSLAACQEKPKITTIVVTPNSAYRTPEISPPFMVFASTDEPENIIAVGQYNSDDCSSPPLGTIVVTDAPGTPLVATNTTGTIKLPGSRACGGRTIPARCLQITWKGAAPLLTTHHGLRWRYSADTAKDNEIDVQVHSMGGGKARCFAD
jgi:hypothetical protein